MWVTNWNNHNVMKLDNNGNILNTITVGANPIGVAIDQSGNVWVVNNDDDTVTKISMGVDSLDLCIALDASSQTAIDNPICKGVVKSISTCWPLYLDLVQNLINAISDIMGFGAGATELRDDLCIHLHWHKAEDRRQK
jgi:hypothetical protein